MAVQAGLKCRQNPGCGKQKTIYFSNKEYNKTKGLKLIIEMKHKKDNSSGLDEARSDDQDETTEMKQWPNTTDKRETKSNHTSGQGNKGENSDTETQVMK